LRASGLPLLSLRRLAACSARSRIAGPLLFRPLYSTPKWVRLQSLSKAGKHYVGHQRRCPAASIVAHHERQGNRRVKGAWVEAGSMRSVLLIALLPLAFTEDILVRLLVSALQIAQQELDDRLLRVAGGRPDRKDDRLGGVLGEPLQGRIG